MFYRVDEPGLSTLRVAVVVPAHDESALIARCVTSLRMQDYPEGRRDIVVIADNCTDDTAARAEEAGARVLVRNEPAARGKGHALRWAFDRLLAMPNPPDAVAVVDADSRAAPGFLRALMRPLEHGATAAQGESLLEEDGSTRTAFRAAAFLLINRVRPAGRTVIGATARLSGNGMAFRSELLVQQPWSAFSSTEDLEYSLRLRVAGIGVAFAGGAVLLSPAAPNPEAAAEQQLRWEGGKLHLARTWLPMLVVRAIRERNAGLLDAAVELAVPPLGLFVAASTIGTLVVAVLLAFGVVPLWTLAPWLVAGMGITAYVVLGLRAASAPSSAYVAMLRAPLFVAQKLLQLPRLLAFRGDTWVRTERATDDSREDT